MNIRWEEKTDDGLEKVEWGFWVRSDFNRIDIVLDNYSVSTRESKRKRKWDIVKSYSRLSRQRNLHPSQRLSEDSVPLTDEIKAKAKKKVVDQLLVVKWSEIK